MRAVVVDGRGGIELRDKPIPEPGPNDVLIAVQATGVCGTDLHLIAGSYEHGRYPVTPGHEFSGVVSGVGTQVGRFREGDFVGVDPNVSCGHCRWCANGAKNLCPYLRPIGVAVDGSCAEYVAVPQDVVYKLSPGLDAPMGALVEPLSCVLHAVHRAGEWKGARVAVYGAGPIGLLTIAVARYMQCSSVVAFEPNQVRRELALHMGAETSFASAADAAQDDGFDIAVDASGHPAAIQSAVDALGRQGRLVQMGVAHADARVQVSPLEVFAKELMIIGSNSLANAYGAASELMTDMAPTLRPLITDLLPLEDYAEAVRRASSADSIKVQVITV
jgi:2-desacetyl-2-hydroxyethyl bacteriochlorophyllide A dehydrogenase